MSLVKRRVVTVNRLFAAQLEAGDNKGKRVFISPADTSEVKNLTQEQLAAYHQSGSITIEEADVESDAKPGEGQAFIDAAPASTTGRKAPAKE